MLRRLVLLLLLAPLACSDGSTDPGEGSARATADRLDAAWRANLVHVVYALPADAADRGLDTTGVLESSIGSLQGWLRAHADGRELRLDRWRGKLDITFVRLARTDAVMAAYGPLLRDSLEAELARAGLIRSNRIYAVYYEGGSTHACGGAAWPPEVPGHIAAIFLKAVVAGAPCELTALRTSPDAFPGYWETALLHDLLHTMGIVSRNAPHHTSALPAHVPERNDLMYSGTAPWIIDRTMVIDVGGDDYYGPSVPAGVVRLSDSPYLTAPAPPAGAAPTSAVAGDGGSLAVSGLPFHPPLQGTR